MILRSVYTLFWVVVVFLYFYNAWTGSFRLWDEGLTAERSREMFETGQWLTPQLYYEPDFNKPPLYYWLTAATMHVFGINEFAVRFWSNVFGIACVFFVYRIARKISGAVPVGYLAATLLIANPFWLDKTREGLLDSTMLAGNLAGFYYLLHAKRSRLNAGVAGVAFGLSILAKAPLALIVFPVAAVYLWLRDRKLDRLLIALSAMILISLPWYLYQIVVHGGEYIHQYISYNAFSRATQTIEGHTGSIFSYIIGWAGLAPISFFLFLATTVSILFTGKPLLRKISPYLILLYAGLLLLSLAASKRELYLVILFPFFAISGGVLLSRIIHALEPRLRVAVLSGILASCAFETVLRYDSHPDHSDGAKQVALHAVRNLPVGESIFVFDYPLHVFYFYTDGRALPISFEHLPGQVQKTGDCHVIVEKGVARSMKEELTQMAFERLYGEDDFALYRISTRKSASE